MTTATKFHVTNSYGQACSTPHTKGDMKCTSGWCNDTGKGDFSGIFPLRCKCGGVIHADLVNPSAVNDDFGSVIDIQCDACGGDVPIDEDMPKLKAAGLML